MAIKNLVDWFFESADRPDELPGFTRFLSVWPANCHVLHLSYNGVHLSVFICLLVAKYWLALLSVPVSLKMATS
jgi:hypothetical protein